MFPFLLTYWPPGSGTADLAKLQNPISVLAVQQRSEFFYSRLKVFGFLAPLQILNKIWDWKSATWPWHTAASPNRIRIRMDAYWSWYAGSESGSAWRMRLRIPLIQVAKITRKNRKKLMKVKKIHVWSAVCSLWRADGTPVAWTSFIEA